MKDLISVGAVRILSEVLLVAGGFVPSFATQK